MLRILLFSSLTRLISLLFLASYGAVALLLSLQPRIPQSDYIGVLSYEGDSNVLRRVRVLDGETEVMAEFSGVAYANGVWWTPDARRMATAAFENHDIKRLFYVDGRKRVFPQASFGWVIPTLAPDHEQLAILDYGLQSATILRVMDIDGRNKMDFQLPAIGSPQWSPDGKWIAFSDGPIYRVRPDSTDFEAISPLNLVALDMVWSPDSQWIAFAGVDLNGETRMTDIFIVRADGSNLIQLTDGLPYTRHPTWSPDGTMLAFSAGEVGHQDIFRLRIADQSLSNLTHNDNEATKPQWSPDGRRIAFLAYDTQSTCLYCFNAVYIMNADGTPQQQITIDIPVSDFAWSPVIN